MEFLWDDLFRRDCELLGKNKSVGLNGHREERFLPLVHCGELIDVGVELIEGGVEVRDLPAEEENENDSVVMEGVSLHLVKRFAKVFIGP